VRPRQVAVVAVQVPKQDQADQLLPAKGEPPRPPKAPCITVRIIPLMLQLTIAVTSMPHAAILPPVGWPRRLEPMAIKGATKKGTPKFPVEPQKVVHPHHANDIPNPVKLVIERLVGPER
jgi:hypothetical protein